MKICSRYLISLSLSIFLIGIYAGQVQAQVMISKCSGVFEFSSPKNAQNYHELIKQMNLFEVQLAAAMDSQTLSELIEEAQQTMNALLSVQNYLPGCTPTWTTRKVEELIDNFYSTIPTKTMLHQISSNLGGVRMIKEILRNGSGPISEMDKNLLKHWNNNTRPYYVFKTLEDRLLKIDQP